MRKYFSHSLMLFLLVITTSGCWDPYTQYIRTQPNTTYHREDGEPRSAARTCFRSVEAFLAPATRETGKLEGYSPLIAASGGPSVMGPSEFIIRIIQYKLTATIGIMFRRISEDPGMRQITLICVALMIAFYAIGVVSGMTQTNGFSIVAMVAKAAIISQLVLSYDFFAEVVLIFTENIVIALSSIMANTFSAQSNGADPSIFTVVDGTLSTFFSMRFWLFMAGLLFAGPKGWIFIMIIWIVMLLYTCAAFRALYIFVSSMIARYFLYFIAPFFLLCFLFKETKSLFDNWLRLLINFSLQPILAFAYLGIMQIIFTSLMGIMVSDGYVCYMRFFGIEMVDQWVYMWRLTNDLGLTASGGQNAEIPFRFLTALSLGIVASLMFMFGGWASKAAADMAGGAIYMGSQPIFGLESAQQRYMSPVLNSVSGGARGLVTGTFSGSPIQGMRDGARAGREAARREAARADRVLIGLEEGDAGPQAGKGGKGAKKSKGGKRK